MGDSKATEYQERIQSLDSRAFRSFWEAVYAGSEIPGWASGKAHEYALLRAFELAGACVTYPFEVRASRSQVASEQVDGVVYHDGLAFICESKDWTRRSDIVAIAKLRVQLMRRPGTTLGIVFCKAGFTDPAKDLASYLAPQMVLLWEGVELDQAIRECTMLESLVAKYRAAVEHGLPFWSIVDGREQA